MKRMMTTLLLSGFLMGVSLCPNSSLAQKNDFPRKEALFLNAEDTVLLHDFAKQNLPPVVEATLKNGMRVLLLEKHSSPTISFHIMFRVGSVDESLGKTGLAHMFEHMIFKGTKSINSKNYDREKPALDAVEKAAQELLREQAKGSQANPQKLASLKKNLERQEAAADRWIAHDEYEKFYEEQGGANLNAYTGEDRTAYLVSLPSNRLETWMRLESDRFKNPVLREFYRERNVVMEERRMRTDSNPQGKLWEALITTAFQVHPYRNDIIGWMGDLENMSLTDAENFFRDFYAPNNAVAVLVGDLNPQKTLALFKKHFETIPARPLKTHYITEEPPQEGEKRVSIEFEAEPQIMMAFHKPNLPHPDDTVFQFIKALLSDGRTSRLYKNLVEGKKIALSASADSSGVGERYPNLFVVYGAPRHPHTASDWEKGVLGELEKLKKELPTTREMDKIRNQLTTELVTSLESNDQMARKLAYYQTIAGNWRYPWELQKRFGEISAQDIQRVAQTYLLDHNRTTAVLVPQKAPAEGEKP
ncbi:MAG: insulinase family protein [Elusimicrobia bacterium]|nr:insulinase family protein [Elusimicrobiota bacterium]